MQERSHGENFFDAYHAASSLPRASSWRFLHLRPSARRLWEAAAAAVIDARPLDRAAANFGAIGYDAWTEESGLPERHFMPFGQLCEAAQWQWSWAASTTRRLAGLKA